MSAGTRWKCPKCDAVATEIAPDLVANPDTFWEYTSVDWMHSVGYFNVTRISRGVVVCVTHCCVAEMDATFNCERIVEVPDELAISKLTRDEVQGLAVAALRRTLPADKAEHVIAALGRFLTPFLAHPPQGLLVEALRRSPDEFTRIAHVKAGHSVPRRMHLARAEHARPTRTANALCGVAFEAMSWRLGVDGDALDPCPRCSNVAGSYGVHFTAGAPLGVTR